jgi:putative flippase GtrA
VNGAGVEVEPGTASRPALSKRASFVRFCLITGLSYAINVGLTAALTELAGWPEEAAFAAALVVAMTSNFLFMRYWIYDGAAGSGPRQVLLYLLSSVIFRGLEYALFLVAHTWLGVPYVLAITGVLGLSFLTKFFYYRAVVFKGQGSASPAA